jgi:hypothetical protein
MPVASFLLKLSPIGFDSEANLAGKKARHEGWGKIGYFTRPFQGRLPFRQGSRSGDVATIKVVSELAVPR